MASDRSSAAAAMTSRVEPEAHEPSGPISIRNEDSAVPSTALPSDATTVHGVAPGSVLAGKYRVVRVIGRGGMGLVVEARHLELDTKVAIKLLFPEFMSYAEASERFLREARAASKLESQHVARVLDVGKIGSGEPFMVMECLAGEDLASYLRNTEGPFPIHDAIDFITQASDAIAEAHEHGIVHRDVKPANLFVTRRSEDFLVKVLDFGISKILGDASTERDVGLTQTTTILGSALYMSPEQMQSAKKVDRRTDIYALGVCLFELIGGEVPYYADSFPELCAKVYTSPPRPLRALRPDAPEGLVRVIERAIAHKPEERFQTVAELVQALSPFARAETRKRMEAIFRKRAPSLTLLLPADGSTEPEEPVSVLVPKKKKKKKRGAGIWILAAALAVGTSAFVFRAHIPGIFARLRGGAPAPAEALAPPPDVAQAPPSAIAVAPEPAPTAIAVVPVATATASAIAIATPSAAPSAIVRAAPSKAVGPSAKQPVTPRQHGMLQPAEAAVDDTPRAAALMPKDPNKTPQPPVSSVLSEEHCFASMPDGTRKQVPCP